MKILENKMTEMAMTSKEDSPMVTYADLIKIVCNTQVQGGYAISDIKARIAIISNCDNIDVEEEIIFENADATYLQNAVKNQKWAAIHKDIIAFTEDIDTMKNKG